MSQESSTSIKSRILVYSSDEANNTELTSLLGWAGYAVHAIMTESEAYDAISAHLPSLILIDVEAVGLNGRELLTGLREAKNLTPIIIIGIGAAMERTLALNEGADDYLNKPFETHELIARIQAVLRRSSARSSVVPVINRLVSDDLVIDRLSRRAWLNEEELILTPKAFALLEYLMTHPDHLVSRDSLLDAVWGWDYPAGIRAVDTRIFELRQALGDKRKQPRFIETVAGQGYRFIGAVEVVV